MQTFEIVVGVFVLLGLPAFLYLGYVALVRLTNLVQLMERCMLELQAQTALQAKAEVRVQEQERKEAEEAENRRLCSKALAEMREASKPAAKLKELEPEKWEAEKTPPLGTDIPK